MTDQQFSEIIKKLDYIIDYKFEIFEEKIKDHISSELSEIRGIIDWLVGVADTDEKERLALGYNFDRKHANHERRIKKLELSANL